MIKLCVLLVFMNLILIQFKTVLTDDNNGDDDLTPYVYKGKNAKLGEFPSTVQLRTLAGQFCGGTLISPKHVLTAAHCIPKKFREDFNIVCGSLTSLQISGPNVQQIQVANSCIHPKYFLRLNTKIKSEKVFNDLAILELKTPVQINEHCKTIELATRRSHPGTKCNMTGWGSHDNEETDVLRYRELTIGYLVQCFRWLFYVPILHVCAIDKSGVRASGIHGDSGGPFYCKGKLEGVICTAKISRLTVMTSVPHYRKWIENFMKTGDRKKYCAIATRYNLSTCVKIFTVAIIVIQYYGIFN